MNISFREKQRECKRNCILEYLKLLELIITLNISEGQKQKKIFWNNKVDKIKIKYDETEKIFNDISELQKFILNIKLLENNIENTEILTRFCEDIERIRKSPNEYFIDITTFDNIPLQRISDPIPDILKELVYDDLYAM